MKTTRSQTRRSPDWARWTSPGRSPAIMQAALGIQRLPRPPGGPGRPDRRGDRSALCPARENYISAGRVEWLHKGSEGIFDDRADEAIVRELLRAALISGRLSLEAERRFLDTPTIVSRTVQADGTVLENEEGSGDEEDAFQLVSYAFAMVMTVAILFGGGLLLESVSDEKENRMVEIILTSVSPLGLMAGKVLAQGALALAQVVLWVGSLAIIGPRIFDQLPEVSDLSIEAGQLVWLLLFFLAGYFVVAVVMAGLGAMTSSYTQSSQLSALVIVPSIIPVAAPQFILESPDGVFARALSFFPVTAPTTVVMRMGQTDLSILELLASLAVVLLSGVLLLYVSARIFRAGILLYGQRMTLGGVLRALREG